MGRLENPTVCLTNVSSENLMVSPLKYGQKGIEKAKRMGNRLLWRLPLSVDPSSVETKVNRLRKRASSTESGWVKLTESPKKNWKS